MMFEQGVGECCGHNMFYEFEKCYTKQLIKEGMLKAAATYLEVDEVKASYLRGGFTSVVLNEYQTDIKEVLEKDFGFKEVYKSFNHRSGNYICLLVIASNVLIEVLFPKEE